jgi:hypothetical protein
MALATSSNSRRWRPDFVQNPLSKGPVVFQAIDDVKVPRAACPAVYGGLGDLFE